jgi:hypothetical protein
VSRQSLRFYLFVHPTRLQARDVLPVPISDQRRKIAISPKDLVGFVDEVKIQEDEGWS